MAIDYTKLRKKLSPEPEIGGDPGVRIRVGIVDTVNANGTVDVEMSDGGLVPDVPVLDGAAIGVGTVVQMVSFRGSLLVLGGVFRGASRVDVFNVENPTFTSAGYTELAGLNLHGVAFTAPASGAVDILVEGWLGVNATVARSRTFMTGQVREGAVINSGTIVDAAVDDQAAVSENEATTGGAAYSYKYVSITYTVDGLTPGASYNVVSMVKTNSASSPAGATFRRRIIVRPI
jgi:hypothetical protein